MGHALFPWGEKECHFSLCHQKNWECKILLNNLIQRIKISGIVEKTKPKTKQKTKQKPKEWFSKTTAYDTWIWGEVTFWFEVNDWQYLIPCCCLSLIHSKLGGKGIKISLESTLYIKTCKHSFLAYVQTKRIHYPWDNLNSIKDTAINISSILKASMSL